MSEKKIKIENNGVYILDPEIKKSINKANLSPSMIGSWLSSPGDWVMNKHIMELVQKEEQKPLIRGSWFHSIMEAFFALPSKDRTFENLKGCVKSVTTEKYPEMMKDENDKNWLKGAIKGYANTWLQNAPNEKIANVFYNGQQKNGIEFFVIGKIGNTKRNTLGFIDRLIEGEFGLLVQDWKTGKTITNYDPDKKISESNSFDYWRQQTIYAMLLEQAGMIVEGASLIFPCSEPPTEVFIEHENMVVRKQVIKDCEQVDKELTEAIENDYYFPFKKGKYNSWASYLCGMGNSPKPIIFEDKLLEIAEIVD